MVREGAVQPASPPKEPCPAEKARGGEMHAAAAGGVYRRPRWRDRTGAAPQPGSLGGGVRSRMEAAMKLVLPAVSLLLTLAAPALAQPAKGPAFYVVLNSLTRKCTVVDRTPRTDTPNITVASDTIYPTRAAAEDAIKALKPCNQ